MQEILKTISKNIDKGSINFCDEDDKIVMEPEGQINLKITAAQEDARNRIIIRISWQVKQEEKKTLSVKSCVEKISL